MRTPSLLLVAALSVGLVSCSETPDDLVAPIEADFRAAVVAADSDADFSFLPPLVSPRTLSGELDGGLLPHLAVDVCRVDGEECPVIATFTAEGDRSERLRLAEDDDAYHVNWSTRGHEAGSYRVIVRAVAVELGSLDVTLVERGRDLRRVPEGSLGVIRRRSLPVRFWVADGAVHVVGAAGGTVTALDGRVTLDIPEGALPGPYAVAVRPTDPEDPDAELAFELAPWDAGFLEPVLLTVRNEPLPIPDDPARSEEYILEHDDAEGAWHEVPSVYDFETGEVRLELTTFALDPVEHPDPEALPEDEPLTPAAGAAALSFSLPSPDIFRIRPPRYRIPVRIPTVRRYCTTGIRVSPAATSVAVGGTAVVALQAMRLSRGGIFGLPTLAWYDLRPSLGSWTSSSSLITVAPGRVTGVAAGTAHYQVKYPSPERRYCRSSYALGAVEVTAPQTATITLSASELTLDPGETGTVDVTLTAADGTDVTGLRPVSYASDDESVATVDADGTITAIDPGSALVTVTSDGVSATVQVTVSAPPPPPGHSTSWSDGEFDPANWTYTLVTADRGGTVDVTVEGSGGDPDRYLRIAQHFDAGSGRSDAAHLLTFHARQGAVHDPAMDGAIGSLDYSESAILFTCEWTECDGQFTGPAVMQDGHIFVHRVGSTTYADFKDTWGPLDATGVTANDFRQVMDASDPGMLFLGSRKPDFSATGSPLQFGFHRWGSHTNSLTPTRTAGIDNWTITLNIDGPDPVSSIALSPSTADLYLDHTLTLTVDITFGSGAVSTDPTLVDWSTDDATIATVDAHGVVTGVGEGTATVTAAKDGAVGQMSVTVGPVPLAQVTITGPASEVEVGSTLQLSATATDVEGNTVQDPNFQWSSDDPGVATVDADGLVTGVAGGSTEIRAHVSNSTSSASDQYSVTVTDPVSRPTASGAIPTTAEIPFHGGHDVAVADDGTGYAVWCANQTLAVARSIDGTTWELMGSTALPSCGSDGDSHAGVDGAGTLYIVTPHGLFTSADGGESFEGPAAVPSHTARSMVVTPAGEAYIVTAPSLSYVELHRSTGGGAFSFVQRVHSPFSDQQIGDPDLDLDGQGTLHMVWRRTNSAGRLHDHLRSDDGGTSWSRTSIGSVSWSHGPAKIASDENGNLIVVFDTFNSSTSQAEMWTYTSTSGGSSWAQHPWSTQAFMTDQAPLAAGRVVRYFTTSAFDGHFGRHHLYVHEWNGSWASNIADSAGSTEADLDANRNGRLCVVQDDGPAWCETR